MRLSLSGLQCNLFCQISESLDDDVSFVLVTSTAKKRKRLKEGEGLWLGEAGNGISPTIWLGEAGISPTI
jgi:hypothetical protein